MNCSPHRLGVLIDRCSEIIMAMISENWSGV